MIDDDGRWWVLGGIGALSLASAAPSRGSQVRLGEIYPPKPPLAARRKPTLRRLLILELWLWIRGVENAGTPYYSVVQKDVLEAMRNTVMTLEANVAFHPWDLGQTMMVWSGKLGGTGGPRSTELSTAIAKRGRELEQMRAEEGAPDEA